MDRCSIAVAPLLENSTSYAVIGTTNVEKMAQDWEPPYFPLHHDRDLENLNERQKYDKSQNWWIQKKERLTLVDFLRPSFAPQHRGNRVYNLHHVNRLVS